MPSTRHATAAARPRRPAVSAAPPAPPAHDDDRDAGGAPPARTAGDAPPIAVKTLAKALGLLDAVAASQHPPTVGELAARTGLARPTAYRLVQALVAAGFLEQHANDQRLAIGYAVLPLAASLLDRNRLRLEALPHLQSLAVRMNSRVNLGILHRQRVLILGGTEKPNLPTIYSRFGRTVPAHCCALGKAMLAFLPPARARAALAARPLEARTPNTITTVPAMLAEFEAIRARGYATERGENTPTSCCVAAPIFGADDEPVGAISVSGRSLEALIADIEAVQQTAELVSHLI